MTTPKQDNMLSIIEQAVTSNIPVESLEKLLELKERFDKEQARKAYITAISTFQGKCPIIVKTKKGVNYMYAPLESIVEQVRPILVECGLSYRIEAKIEENVVTATCIITHVDGHSESSSFTSKSEVLVSNKGNLVRTAMQDTASALTFAKRYAFTNALGIMTGDEDTDAAKKRDNESVKEQFLACTTADEAQKLFMALTNEQRGDKEVLALARDTITKLKKV